MGDSFKFPVTPIVDTTNVLKGSDDATKQVRFEVDGITTGTTRVVTIPDADGTIAYTGAASTVITVADEAADTTSFPLFATAATGDLGPKSNAALTFNASTAELGATTMTATSLGGTLTTAAQANVTSVGTLTGLTMGGDIILGDGNLIEVDPAPASDLNASGWMVTETVDANATGVGAALYRASDGNYDEADASAAATMPCSGIALETGTGSKKVLKQGYIRKDAWTWTVGGVIYVSETTGAFTQTAPTTSAAIVQVIGVAKSADIIEVNISPDQILIT